MVSIEELVQQVKQLEERVARIESLPVSHISNEDARKRKKLSLREFVNEKKPTSANDTCLTVAYYLETYQERESFNVDDLRAAYKEAKIQLPANLNDVVNKNIKKALMAQSDRYAYKKTWTLTRTGENTIMKGFSKDK